MWEKSCNFAQTTNNCFELSLPPVVLINFYWMWPTCCCLFYEWTRMLHWKQSNSRHFFTSSVIESALDMITLTFSYHSWGLNEIFFLYFKISFNRISTVSVATHLSLKKHLIGKWILSLCLCFCYFLLTSFGNGHRSLQTFRQVIGNVIKINFPCLFWPSRGGWVG